MERYILTCVYPTLSVKFWCLEPESNRYAPFG